MCKSIVDMQVATPLGSRWPSEVAQIVMELQLPERGLTSWATRTGAPQRSSRRNVHIHLLRRPTGLSQVQTFKNCRLPIANHTCMTSADGESVTCIWYKNLSSPKKTHHPPLQLLLPKNSFLRQLTKYFNWVSSNVSRMEFADRADGSRLRWNGGQFEPRPGAGRHMRPWTQQMIQTRMCLRYVIKKNN